jgi:RimJ/RimL family protein N-acetyltransferase
MSSQVTLRRATAADGPLIHGWRTEPSTSVFQPTLSLSLTDVRTMLANRAAVPIVPNAQGTVQWLIVAPEGSVGWITVTISPDDRRHAKGSIGYTIGEQFRGRGYGSAGLRAVLPIAFDQRQLALERLEAVAAVNNIGSRRVLEHNDFHWEGVLRGLLVINGVRVDHAIYGLLRSDWEGTDDR